MKKYIIIFLSLLSSIVASNSFADSITGAGVIHTITEVVNSMAENGAIGTDVAKYRIGYYSDQIYVHGVELTVVQKESDDWARGELSKIVSRKLYTLKDQWFLTIEKYDTYIKSYSGMISSGNSLQFWSMYKDFIRFEKEVINSEIPRTQDALYNMYKDRLALLLKEQKITQEKYDTWLVKIETQVYQYKSDPDLMSREFEEESAKYTTIIARTPDYPSEVKAQYGKQYAKMSVRNLQLTLTRTKKLEKKYTEWSKNKLKIQAQIELLNEEIAKKKTLPPAKK
jgi:hypothetical protein